MGKTVKTVAIKGNVQYAKVATRIVEFRGKNPRGKIHTEHEMIDDDTFEFRAYVWKDSTELIKMLASGISIDIAKFSCDANGSATAKATKVEQDKGFEKQETIAVGRALAMLGYATDGNVASDEEMEEFENFKKNKAAEAIQNACKALEDAKTIDELRTTFSKLEMAIRGSSEVTETKDRMKAKLAEEKKDDN